MAHSIDRREFLQRTATALSAAAIVAPGDWRSDKTLARVGVQLYTVRDEMAKSVDATLAKVASIGYKEVEFAGYYGKKPAEVAAQLKATGLLAPSSHISLDEIRNRWPETLDLASTIGHQYLVCAYIVDKERTLDGFKKIAHEFNVAGEKARAHNITFAYHNHDFEFVPVGEGKDRILPYEYLLKTCDPKLVKMEMDLYWTNKAKQDPLQYFAKYPGRFHLVHVKDMAADGSMTAVGSGQLPFAKYFAKSSEAGIKHYFVEHDQPGDAYASIESSYKHLSKLSF